MTYIQFLFKILVGAVFLMLGLEFEKAQLASKNGNLSDS